MSVSTHVLDAAHGVPAQGMRLMLERLDGAERTHMGVGTTDADGRCPGLTEGVDLVAGTYRLRFETGEWFARTDDPDVLPLCRDRLRDHGRGRAPPRAAAAQSVRVLDVPGELSSVPSRGPPRCW